MSKLREIMMAATLMASLPMRSKPEGCPEPDKDPEPSDDPEPPSEPPWLAGRFQHGPKVSRPRKCKCGQMVSPDTRTCTWCGKELLREV